MKKNKKTPPNARLGKDNRIFLGARIDPATAKQIAMWQRAKVSKGLLLDRLCAHAVRTNFSPATDCF